jgi:hypothetical protein
MLWFLLACGTPSIENDSVQGLEPILVGERSSGGCATSCALKEKSITQEDWLISLDTWAQQEIGISTPELDTLLFYAKDSLSWLPVFGTELDDMHYSFLEHELRRDLVDIEMRLVDEFGNIRGVLDSEAFPLKEKQHLAFVQTKSLGWLETGGKIKRVGLAHLWSRW